MGGGVDRQPKGRAMKSPFPGMDPYLEPYWSSFHALMMGALTAALNQSLWKRLGLRWLMVACAITAWAFAWSTTPCLFK